MSYLPCLYRRTTTYIRCLASIYVQKLKNRRCSPLIPGRGGGGGGRKQFGKLYLLLVILDEASVRTANEFLIMMWEFNIIFEICIYEVEQFNESAFVSVMLQWLGALCKWSDWKLYKGISTLRTINEPERKMIQKNVRTAYNENHQTIMKSNQ